MAFKGRSINGFVYLAHYDSQGAACVAEKGETNYTIKWIAHCQRPRSELLKYLAHRVTVAVRRTYDAIEIVVRVATGRR